MKAIYNGVVLAESNNTVVIEGNHYFPADSVNKEFFSDSSRTTVCPWKGTANYYNIQDGNGATSDNAAWYYPDVSELAKGIKNRVAFWKGVEIIK